MIPVNPLVLIGLGVVAAGLIFGRKADEQRSENGSNRDGGNRGGESSRIRAKSGRGQGGVAGIPENQHIETPVEKERNNPDEFHPVGPSIHAVESDRIGDNLHCEPDSAGKINPETERVNDPVSDSQPQAE